MAGKKKGGLTSQIGRLVYFIIISAIFLALLSRFDWDIILMFKWILSGIWNIIITLADIIAGNKSFRQLTA